MDENKNIIGEAPASATLSVVTPKGYNTLFTLREMSGEVLLKKIGALETKLDELGYKPQPARGVFAKKEVEFVQGKLCPLCKGRLIKKFSKEGKEFHKCENNKWNAMTQKAEGCTYVDWLNPKQPNNPYTQEAIPVEEYDQTK